MHNASDYGYSISGQLPGAESPRAIKHSATIDWPNGQGYTECTPEYAAIYDEIEAIKPADVRMDDLSAEDYETFNRLDSQRCQMQMAGHVGRGVRY
jgi:hypothetical protein